MASEFIINQFTNEVHIRLGDSETSLTVDETHQLVNELVAASTLAQDLDPEINDWIRIPMQYLLMEVEALDGIGHAIAHCWIRFQSRTNARYVAQGHLADDGWSINSMTMQRTVTKADYEHDDWGRDYFDQAKLDETVFVLEEMP